MRLPEIQAGMPNQRLAAVNYRQPAGAPSISRRRLTRPTWLACRTVVHGQFKHYRHTMPEDTEVYACDSRAANRVSRITGKSELLSYAFVGGAKAIWRSPTMTPKIAELPPTLATFEVLLPSP